MLFGVAIDRGQVTATLTVVEWQVVPEQAVTVTANDRGEGAAKMVRVANAAAPGVRDSEVGLTVARSDAGAAAARLTDPVKVWLAETETVAVPEWLCLIDREAGPTETEKAGAAW